ncbi:hypothetical protein ATCV1_Z006R [Acanthocystis turfacea chlorella virus 1]|uniref:Uncharacterized protein Z006R n=1 Tax=Chlorovirus heliozoae TaxID=322019 RepID=A7K7W6_9PHYC|nr:hypothetical protein ATCV1_Z006R [Acanthocystis turfacea chlorella virus 1]ABT16140.1 hypothetical protein ATCV1_Z006R [Acanthocystis turfacea chlorella virus 1]
MNNFDKALQSLQPNAKEIVTAFLLNDNFADKETHRSMMISFTTSSDHHLGFRRIRLGVYKSGFIQFLEYDKDIIQYGVQHLPIILAATTPSGEFVKQTFENVMNLIETTPIYHILSIDVYRTYSESERIYHWSDVQDLAKKASRDPTLSIK